jgi:hypothetical protein
MRWVCKTCGKKHDDLPLCFGAEAPWRFLVPPEEFAKRVVLSADQCIVDEKEFFIRGHIPIPIPDLGKNLDFSVWSSLSGKSFAHMCARWNAPDRAKDPPYFGWLCTQIPIYPMKELLKLSVQSRDPGLCPIFTLEPTEHPFSIDQHRGISVARWHEIALMLLGQQAAH